MEISDLINGGFVRKEYQGQEGEFICKSVPIEKLKQSAAELIDSDVICEGMEAMTEVRPDGLVQLYISDADVLVGPYPLNSVDGQSLVRDAVAAR